MLIAFEGIDGCRYYHQRYLCGFAMVFSFTRAVVKAWPRMIGSCCGWCSSKWSRIQRMRLLSGARRWSRAVLLGRMVGERKGP